LNGKNDLNRQDAKNAKRTNSICFFLAIFASWRFNFFLFKFYCREFCVAGIGAGWPGVPGRISPLR
jgi:hypothetical protein